MHAHSANEQEFVALQEDKTEGHDWERVARYVDFTSKVAIVLFLVIVISKLIVAKKGSRNTRDTTKLKSILLQVQHLQ